MPDCERHNQTPSVSEFPLVLLLSALDASMLPLVGGKAANLGELIRAGFSVPRGFCVTTAAYSLLNADVSLEPILAELAVTRTQDTLRLGELAATARAALLHAPVPASCASAIAETYQALFPGESVPVAVRSSATAEDLPNASFAGQQETYLNVVGTEAVLTAVQQCWASLWTERAVSYRQSRDIDHRTVRLAVVVQSMVDAQVAGVLFTANPLTGARRQAMIDANPGLGEAIVSGAVNPDHYVVNTPTREIVERRLGDKRLIMRAMTGGGIARVAQSAQRATVCLSDERVRMLAELGARVEASFGAPQDIEWAIDASGAPWLLQARPITTLFPVPADAPSADEELRVYLSFNVQQGTHLPFTPMGISALRLLASSLATSLGFPPRDRLHGPGFVTEAASRLFIDVTGALRNSLGRRQLIGTMEEAEIHAATIFQQLGTDPRFGLARALRWPFLRTIVLLLVRTRLPWHLLQALLLPRRGRERLLRLERIVRDGGTCEAAANRADPADLLAAVEQIFFDPTMRLMTSASSAMVAGMAAYTLDGTLLGDLATASERQEILRGLPANPTTEMNRALWALAQQVHSDPVAAHLVRDTPPARLAADYHQGSLPPLLQRGLAHFLATYGHRSVAELDLGVPRWSEDPTYVLGILKSLLQLDDLALSPETQYRHAAHEAEAMIAELTRRARRTSWVRGLLVGFCLSRAHALFGLRELTRFCLTLLLARARVLLGRVGAALAQDGRLETADDIFFITLPEAHAALVGADVRSRVRARRASYQQELARRHVPLVLLSDGTEPTTVLARKRLAPNTLQGTPASPGTVTAHARVILDPTGASLAPGEILVVPSTDPGWTPLFLAAGGLVMETGGTMSHGVIFAREFGIPAVVGVPDATERIPSGSRLTIDGTMGTIVIEQSTDA